MEREPSAEQIAKEAEVKRRTIARNDQDIEQEWESLGLEPIRVNGRPVSVTLAKLLGIQPRPDSQAAE